MVLTPSLLPLFLLCFLDIFLTISFPICLHHSSDYSDHSLLLLFPPSVIALLLSQLGDMDDCVLRGLLSLLACLSQLFLLIKVIVLPVCVSLILPLAFL